MTELTESGNGHDPYPFLFQETGSQIVAKSPRKPASVPHRQTHQRQSVDILPDRPDGRLAPKHCGSCAHTRSSIHDRNQSRSKLRGIQPKRLNSIVLFYMKSDSHFFHPNMLITIEPLTFLLRKISV